MAAERLPDFDEMLVELQQLEREERAISAYRRKLHARLDSFPNEITERKEREVSAKRRELHRRIDWLRAQLTPVMRVDGA